MLKRRYESQPGGSHGSSQHANSWGSGRSPGLTVPEFPGHSAEQLVEFQDFKRGCSESLLANYNRLVELAEDLGCTEERTMGPVSQPALWIHPCNPWLVV
ncbi:unnamed protein product [Closterium sp. NIES-53]